MRTLLALGPQATARYYEYAGQSQQQGKQVVYLVYAVTYVPSDPAGLLPAGDDPGHGGPAAANAGQSPAQPKGSFRTAETFFVLLELMRHAEQTGRTNWQLLRARGGVRPGEFQSP